MQCSFSLNNLDVRLNLQSWSFCLRCCSVVVSSKGMHKVEHTHTHRHKSPTKCLKFKCNTVSVSFLACRCNSVVLSSKVGRNRKKSVCRQFWEWYCNCGLPACCSQPVAGGVIYADLWGELALTWSHRLCLLRVLLCGSLCYRLSPFQALWKVTLPPCCQACVFIYSLCERWVFPPLLWNFPPTATFRSFPAPAYWAVLLLLPAAMFIYSSLGKWVFPPPLSQASPLLVAGCTPCSRQRLSGPPTCLFTIPGRIPFP
jgi:hypothetical protein